MDSLEKEAADAGKIRGWEHANYVDAYGGTMEPEESEIDIPSQYLQVPTYYVCAYFEGIDEYIGEQMRDAWPDFREGD